MSGRAIHKNNDSGGKTAADRRRAGSGRAAKTNWRKGNPEAEGRKEEGADQNGRAEKRRTKRTGQAAEDGTAQEV